MSSLKNISPKFHLSDAFLEQYKNKKPNFGFNGLGEFVYKRTYARTKPDGYLENWWETTRRVVDGVYRIQQCHIETNGLGWNETKGHSSAEEMYKYIFDMKILPAGRQLWAMTEDLIEKRGMFAALCNCCFISSASIARRGSFVFRFLMDSLMNGVGVGFDCRGRGKIDITKPRFSTQTFGHASQISNKKTIDAILRYEETLNGYIAEYNQKIQSDKTPSWEKDSLKIWVEKYKGEIEYFSNICYSDINVFEIPDSREGWVEVVGNLIDTYLEYSERPSDRQDFRPVLPDFKLIRPAGSPIKTFGGVSSGPKPLCDLLINIRTVLEKNVGSPITTTTIADICNMIAVCVVSGNVRRSAEIALGEPDDEEFRELKNYVKNPDRMAHGWASNNSILATLGMDYSKYAENINMNGEPGFCWLENSHTNRRMGEYDTTDNKVNGYNACAEINLFGGDEHDDSLGAGEMCILSEVFPYLCKDKADFLRAIKYAYLIAKTVTLGSSHWVETNRVQMRNRRIGVSLSGVFQFYEKYGIAMLRDWCESGYQEIRRLDDVYSGFFCVPKSIRVTTIKPSGSISILNASTSGIHAPISRCYIRRVRLMNNSPLIKSLKDAGYHIELCENTPETTCIVSFPVKIEDKIRISSEISIWEKAEFAALLSAIWSDNATSVTLDYDKETEGKFVEPVLNYIQYKVKSVSFLPKSKTEVIYKQCPYEDITEEQYIEMSKDLKPIDFSKIKGAGFDVEVDNYCSSEKCELPVRVDRKGKNKAVSESKEQTEEITQSTKKQKSTTSTIDLNGC